MLKKINFLFLLLLLITFFQASSCKTSQSIIPAPEQGIQPLKLSGGSSGMEKLGDQSYLVVYDIKNYKTGTRMAMIKIANEAIEVSPINISGWGEEGKSNDLESICKIPGKINEYFIAESGNWKRDIGRIFHVQVDTTNLSAKILGITKLPYKNINNVELVGDQYESMLCLPYMESERILILGERGGSEVNPRGIIRWGIYNLNTHQLKFSESGMQGIPLNAPGNWTDIKGKRDITDLHIDSEGGIWASSTEDTSEVGPFYSTIYKIGQVDSSNKERPFNIYSNFPKWEAVSGFKIEALSGPSNNINCTHSFGTEDEMYGGVWRPISIE
ncbi:MAG TPA: hypothetical protein VKN36_13285 [Eudoraea sp.]|nr:hypothetical protein [Eudoraea sp.]